MLSVQVMEDLLKFKELQKALHLIALCWIHFLILPLQVLQPLLSCRRKLSLDKCLTNFYLPPEIRGR